MRVGQQDDLRHLMPRVLIADAEQSQARQAAVVLREAGYECLTFFESEEALEELEQEREQIIIADPAVFSLSASELASRIRHKSPRTVLILLVSTPTVSTAAAAIRRGAFDYLTKPINGDELTSVVGKAVEMGGLRRENRLLQEQLAVARMAAAFVAESPRSRELASTIRRAAPAPSPVLIEGESGTGKELVAHMLHHWSNRAHGPFVRIGFKSLVAGDVGSDASRTESAGGAFALLSACAERARGGTLFLDEVGEASKEFQAALLKLIGEGASVTRRKERDGTSVRIVAASNRNLASATAAELFRPDLYFELNVIPIHLPPLRERREDIVPLARHFLSLQAAESGRSLVLTAEAERTLLSHSWPGNVRELERTIERAVVMGTVDRISAEVLGIGTSRPEERATSVERESERAEVEPERVDERVKAEASAPPTSEEARASSADTSAGAASTAEPAPATTVQAELLSGTLQECLDRAAAIRIKAAIDAVGGNRGAAATALGVDRTTLYRLMRRLGL